MISLLEDSIAWVKHHPKGFRPKFLRGFDGILLIYMGHGAEFGFQLLAQSQEFVGARLQSIGNGKLREGQPGLVRYHPAGISATSSQFD